jgi:hypothetical protein
MVATARGPKTAGLSLFAFVIHLHREVPAYEAGDDRFYGLVACQRAPVRPRSRRRLRVLHGVPRRSYVNHAEHRHSSVTAAATSATA